MDGKYQGECLIYVTIWTCIGNTMTKQKDDVDRGRTVKINGKTRKIAGCNT